MVGSLASSLVTSTLRALSSLHSATCLIRGPGEQLESQIVTRGKRTQSLQHAVLFHKAMKVRP